MLKRVNKGKPALELICPKCKTEYESKYILGQVVKYLDFVQEHENFSVDPCPNCGEGIVFNFNLPDKELTEDFMERHHMPEAERINRRNIKELKGQFTFEEVTP